MDGGAFLGGLVKGITNMMPQDDPDVKIFNEQTKITELQKKLAKEYEAVGKMVMESDASDNYPEQKQRISLITDDINSTKLYMESIKKEKEEAERRREEEAGNYVCSACGHENPEGTKFCQECGNRLQANTEPVCPSCGKVNRPGVRFCGECGARIES